MPFLAALPAGAAAALGAGLASAVGGVASGLLKDRTAGKERKHEKEMGMQHTTDEGVTTGADLGFGEGLQEQPNVSLQKPGTQQVFANLMKKNQPMV